MSLMTERPLDRVHDLAESRRMCRCGESAEESAPFLGGKIELSRAAIGDVGRYDSSNLVAERLNGNY